MAQPQRSVARCIVRQKQSQLQSKTGLKTLDIISFIHLVVRDAHMAPYNKF